MRLFRFRVRSTLEAKPVTHDQEENCGSEEQKKFNA